MKFKLGYPVLRTFPYDVAIGGKTTSMSKSRNDRNLSENEIVFIEQSLNEGLIPVEIARQLGRDPSGIRKEIKSYSSYFGSKKHCELCLEKKECKISFLCHPIKDYKKCSSCKKCDDAASRCAFFRIEMQCEILKKKHFDRETASPEEKRKIAAYLNRRGFGYDDISECLT